MQAALFLCVLKKMKRERWEQQTTLFVWVYPDVGYHAGKPIESVVYCFYKKQLY